MDAKECRFCAYADSNRVNQHGEIRCKRYSCYTRKFDTCEDFISEATKKLFDKLGNTL